MKWLISWINWIKTMFRTGSWVAVVIVMAVAFLVAVLIWIFLGRGGLLVLAIAAAYGIICYKTIAENEMGVKIFLGKPYLFVDSGPCWIWFPFEKIVIFSKTQQQADFPASNIVTQPGTYVVIKVEEKGGRQTSRKIQEEIRSAEIGVDTDLFWFWPTGNDLVEAVKILPTRDPRGLTEHIRNAVIHTIRRTGADTTWRHVNQDRDEFEGKIRQALLFEEDPHNKTKPPSILSQLKIKRFNLVITNVVLPNSLKDALTEVEVSRRKKEVAEFEGSAERIRITERGIGESDARRRMLEVVKAAGIDFELLDALREMAKGTSNTILYQLPTVIAQKMEQMLGGTSWGNLWNMLGSEGQKVVQTTIEKQLAELAKTSGGIPIPLIHE